jgi:hypothetical protein
LIPIRAANAVGRLVSKGVDPAGTLETLSAVQPVRREGAKGQLLFVAPPEEAFPAIMGGKDESGGLGPRAFFMDSTHSFSNPQRDHSR